MIQQILGKIYNLLKTKYPTYRVTLQAVRYLILLTILIFCSLVSVTTQNEVVDKEILVGLSQPGKCTSRYENYFVGSRDIFSNTISKTNSNNLNLLTNPVCGYGDGKLCIDDQHLASCKSTLTNNELFQMHINTFTDTFDIPEHTYFPFILPIIVLCLFSIYLIVYTGVVQERVRQVNSIYSNEIIGIALAIMLVISASEHKTKYDENCGQIYNDPTNREDFCKKLNICQLSVSSVINMSNNIAQYYITVLYSFFIIWTTFLIIHFTIFSTYHHHIQQEILIEEEHNRILNHTGEILLEALNEVPPEFVNRYIKNWVYTSQDNVSQEHAACSICLSTMLDGTILPDPRDSLPSLLTNVLDDGNEMNPLINNHVNVNEVRNREIEMNALNIGSNANTFDGKTLLPTILTPNMEKNSVGINTSHVKSHNRDEPENFRPQGGIFEFPWKNNKTASYSSVGTETDENLNHLNNLEYTRLQQGTNEEEVPLKFCHLIELSCGHIFHKPCILQWATVSTNTGCPVCRQPL
jgi:hypothetical protein